MKLTQELFTNSYKISHPLLKEYLDVDFVISMPKYKNADLEDYCVFLYSIEGSNLVKKVTRDCSVLEFLRDYVIYYDIDDDDWVILSDEDIKNKLNQNIKEDEKDPHDTIKNLQELLEDARNEIHDKDALINKMKSENSNFKISFLKDVIAPHIKTLKLSQNCLDTLGFNQDSGIDLMIKNMLSSLKKFGIEIIPCAKGDIFDPEQHHAIMGDSLWVNGKFFEGVISEVISDGYTVDGVKVMFPQVKVERVEENYE